MQNAGSPTNPEPGWSEESHSWTWPMIVQQTLNYLGRKDVALSSIYDAIGTHPKTQGKQHWKDRVRATIERDPQYVRTGPGLWSFAYLFSNEEVAEFRRLRRERWPLLGPRKEKS